MTATKPLSVVHCHCSDCRRWTGAAVATFVAVESVAFRPHVPSFSVNAGVERWVCVRCGSPLAAAFDYIPGQRFLPVGILNEADQLAAERHCHAEDALPWLHLSDDLPRAPGSARDSLTAAAT